MIKPRRFLLVLPAVAVLLGARVPLASADPVAIKSGSISVPASSALSSPIHLEGTDGVSPFAFSGFISPDSIIAVRNCKPCDLTATMISLTIHSNGQDLTGMLTYGADHYSVGGLSDSVGNLFLAISGSALLPPPPTVTNQLATITGSFGFSQAFFQPPLAGGPFAPANSLLGSGVATISLFAENPGDGVPRWSLLSAKYKFEPIPEPASLVLMASGLVGVALRRRRKHVI